MSTTKINSWEDLILHHCEMTPSRNKKFVSFEGDERSMEEQIVYLSQTVRVLEKALEEQNEMMYDLLSRICYLESQ